MDTPSEILTDDGFEFLSHTLRKVAVFEPPNRWLGGEIQSNSESNVEEFNLS